LMTTAEARGREVLREEPQAREKGARSKRHLESIEFKLINYPS
jgi:hypothetical protein